MDNILDYIFNSFLDRKEDKITNKIFHNKTKSKKQKSLITHTKKNNKFKKRNLKREI
jgi:hypothetical protein